MIRRSHHLLGIRHFLCDHCIVILFDSQLVFQFHSINQAQILTENILRKKVEKVRKWTTRGNELWFDIHNKTKANLRNESAVGKVVTEPSHWSKKRNEAVTIKRKQIQHQQKENQGRSQKKRSLKENIKLRMKRTGPFNFPSFSQQMNSSIDLENLHDHLGKSEAEIKKILKYLSKITPTSVLMFACLFYFNDVASGLTKRQKKAQLNKHKKIDTQGTRFHPFQEWSFWTIRLRCCYSHSTCFVDDTVEALLDRNLTWQESSEYLPAFARLAKQLCFKKEHTKVTRCVLFFCLDLPCLLLIGILIDETHILYNIIHSSNKKYFSSTLGKVSCVSQSSQRNILLSLMKEESTVSFFSFYFSRASFNKFCFLFLFSVSFLLLSLTSLISLSIFLTQNSSRPLHESRSKQDSRATV